MEPLLVHCKDGLFSWKFQKVSNIFSVFPLPANVIEFDTIET